MTYKFIYYDVIMIAVVANVFVCEYDIG
uniref:Uncharacterized protein n=1 Tax=Anguilla anguilla TaxID=7936 RepID=A0A0E9TDB8_ANGAN